MGNSSRSIKMAQINVRVDDEVRDDWEAIVENDPRFRSVQELIRHAMADYIDENDLGPDDDD